MIVSAAVKFILDDYCGTEVCIPVHRHKDGAIICKRLLGYEPSEAGYVEGFLTDDGEFLNRYAALDHADYYGQLDHLGDEDKESVLISGILMSEDLW